MLLQFHHQVGRELRLTISRDRPLGGKVIGDALAHRRLVGIVVSRLHDVYVLAGEIRLQLLQGGGQRAQPFVPEGIVAQAEDVKFHATAGEVLEILYGIAGVLDMLEMNDHLRLGADLAASRHRLLEDSRKVVLVVHGTRVDAADVPEHSARNLVAHLDEIRRSAFCHQMLQRFLGVVIDFVGHRRCRFQLLPRLGHGLMRRICPGVAIVEIKHEGEALLLDTLAEGCHISQILTHGRVRVALRRHKEANTLGVPTHRGALQELQHVGHGETVAVVILLPHLLVARQQRDVAAQEPFLSTSLCRCEKQGTGQYH